jgi:D-alanine-D-alanine ligase
MNTSARVGIVFNAYEPRPTNTGERLSEESVADMAGQVQGAVENLGCRATLIPLQRSLYTFLHKIKESNLDLLINLCEGYFGRPQWESNVAGIFEILGFSFTGSDSKTLALCQDKFRAKAVMGTSGLPTARAQLITAEDAPREIPLPVIVKPNNEDASLGIYPESVARAEEDYRAQVSRVFRNYGRQAIVESFIDGREFNVAVMENSEVVPLPVSEIDFSELPNGHPRILSYDAKWFEDHPLFQKTPPVCPAPIDEALRGRLQSIAVEAFRIMGCRDYARIDMRMDAKGRVYILEVNPNPDISLNAGYARSLAAAGIGYPEFWKTMVDNAMKRKNRRDPSDEG